MKYLLTLVLCVGLAGCGLPPTGAVTKPGSPKKVEKVVSTSSAHWIAIAELIESNTLTSSFILTQTLDVLVQNKKLTTSDMEAFDAKFPNFTKTERQLTKDDAALIRTLTK